MKKWVFCHIRWQNWWTCESWTYKTRKLRHGKHTFSWEWSFVVNDNCSMFSLMNCYYSQNLTVKKKDLSILKQWVIFLWLNNWLNNLSLGCGKGVPWVYRAGERGGAFLCCGSLQSLRRNRPQSLSHEQNPSTTYYTEHRNKTCINLHTCYTNCLLVWLWINVISYLF